MTQVFTIETLIAEVPGLSRRRLEQFIEAGIVAPVQAPQGRPDAVCFHRIDRARLTLACEMADLYDLQDDAVSVLLNLVDQLHGVRAELRALMRAVEAEPPQTRERIIAALRSLRR